MDPIKRGDITEARGLKALNELRERYPKFVLKVRRTSPGVDARGIDVFVEISLPKGTQKRAMTVPIELKSSFTGISKWRVVHSDLHRAGVLHFYIPSRMSDMKLRRLFFRSLMRVRLNSRNGMLYHSMFQRLFRGGSRNLRKIVDMIKTKRALEKSRGPTKKR